MKQNHLIYSHTYQQKSSHKNIPTSQTEIFLNYSFKNSSNFGFHETIIQLYCRIQKRLKIIQFVLIYNLEKVQEIYQVPEAGQTFSYNFQFLQIYRLLQIPFPFNVAPSFKLSVIYVYYFFVPFFRDFLCVLCRNNHISRYRSSRFQVFIS